jgi:hypothetical protein
MSDTENAAMSGVLFEEAMFAVLADREIFADVDGTDRHYHKYFANGTPSEEVTKVGFEPRADGGNLDGSWQYPVTEFADNPLALIPGCCNFKDYILDMRTKMELLFAKMSEVDSDASAAEIKLAHLSGVKDAHFSDLDSYVGDDYLHDQDELGQSGVFYDVDLREVQWQPLLRFGKFKEDESVFNPSSPIIPSFCRTDGSLIGVSSRDLTKSAAIGGIVEDAYIAANANRIMVFGDGFTTGAKAYLFDMWDDKKESTSLVCTSTASRSEGLNQAMDAGIGYFSIGGSIPSGIKRLFLFDTSNDILPSSQLSFWPIRSGDELDDMSPSRNTKKVGDTFVRLSGLQVFNDYFAVVSSLGIEILSPVNGDTLWTRFADQDTWSVSDPYGHSATGSWPPAGGYSPGEYLSYGFMNEPIPASIGSWITTYAAIWDSETLTLGGANTSGPWPRSDSFGGSIPGMPDVSAHSPALGESLSNYQIFNQREGSDAVVYEVIWDGANTRGVIFSALSSTSSPNTNGTINGELFGKYPSDQSPRFWHMRVDRTRDVFPLPPQSGINNAGSYEMDRGRFTVYLDTTIGHDFEPPSYISPYSDFSIGPQHIMQPTGDLDTGDGSAFIRFNAKPLGAISTSAYIGRVIMDSSGGSEILKIIEYWGPIGTAPLHTYSV